METKVEMEKMMMTDDGNAVILAIGTATPSHSINQADFPRLYFDVTNAHHISAPYKATFTRICERSAIKTRYTHLTEEMAKGNPNLGDYMSPSLDARHEIATEGVPKLGKAAAEKAVKEWGGHVSAITHLVMCTYSAGDMPGADYHLSKLLGLSPSVKRYMLYQQGCHGGGSVLRLAKDLAENNRGARVLVVCSEISVVGFRGPSETDKNNILAQVLFGDGAGAVIVGAHPDLSIERPIFVLALTKQTILPNSDGAIGGHLCEAGLILKLREDVPKLISNNLESCLKEAFSPLDVHDWNSIFWVAHPGGPAILDYVEAKLSLKKEKLRASRQVLQDYGNMSSGSVLFILDEMRNKSLQNGHKTTGEGFDWGVLFGFGPGITVETVVLRSVPITK